MGRVQVGMADEVTAASAPLRIGLYSPELPDTGAVNGIVTYSRIMRDALRALGNSVTVVSADQIEHSDGRIEDLPKPGGLVGRVRTFVERQHVEDGSDPWVRLQILDAFRAARSAGVQIFEIEESFGWARRLAGQGVAIVERLHGPHGFVRDQIETVEKKRSGDRREAAEIASFHKVQAITAPTQRLIGEITERYELSLPLARAIPNPMPVAPGGPAWNIERVDVDQILFVGRFDLCKGADIAVRAFARALTQRPSLKLLIVGPDRGLAQPDGEIVHFNEFIGREVSPDICSRIHFLGTQRPERIAELRLQSAFSLVPSRFENFAYSISEAMAVGMAVLTTDTFGGSELVRDGRDGRIVPIGDVVATADAILALASSPQQLADMGRSGYERIREWLSPARIAQETVSLYREAMLRL